mgnify:FL=1
MQYYINMKKLIFSLCLFLLFISCGVDVKPNVTINNDINLTIDGENVDGIQGEWIITSETKNEDGKEVITITVKKNEL